MGIGAGSGAEPAEDESFSSFFLRTVQRVTGTVAVAIGRVDLAEDVTQEAYFRAHQRWQRVGGLERPDLWVVRVAVNLGRDALRKLTREEELRPGGAGDRPARGSAADAVDSMWVEWGLAQLPPMQRAAVVLHHLEDREVEDVARTLDRSRETIKTNLRLARLRLRRIFAETD
jgi:RNA polymerase sigma-70 factor (ECF subfamily)